MQLDVSVLLGVRDGMPSLMQAVESVLNQVGPSLELIIVDDGSSDETCGYLESLKRRDSRVLVLRNNVSKGLTKCLNQALRFAKGSFIARIDHDDLWLQGKLCSQVNAINQDATLVLVATGYCEEDLAGRWSRRQQLPVCETDHDIRNALYRFNPLLHSSILVRRSVIFELGGYNERFRVAQDYELWTRVLSVGKAMTLANVLCVRRLGDNNISIRREREQRLNALRAKFSWAKTNGFSYQLLVPALRDLAVILAPQALKAALRKSRVATP